jgi:rSAM/selenodomain-associated transferase 1
MAWSLPGTGVLGIFGKRPDPVRAKTRLAEALGANAAADIAEAMLFDTLETWRPGGSLIASGSRVVLVFDPADAGPWFDARVPAELALQPQVAGGLGERLAAFFAGEFADGADKVVVLGADSPTLDPSFVVSAFLLLDHKDAVIGPATDGGFVLLGLRPPFEPGLLEGIAWSTSHVLAQTVERLGRAGRSLALLPPWYDVDTADDWCMLQGHLRAMRAAGKTDASGSRLLAIHPQ